MGYTLPIARIQASSQNNIAHTTKDRAYMWGSNAHHKLGINNHHKNLEVPKPVCWLVLSSTTIDDTDDYQVSESEVANLKLRTIVIDHEFYEKKGAKYMKSVRSFHWGE
jgi:alpha-tubulin suppressor-like RCC1 family protein